MRSIFLYIFFCTQLILIALGQLSSTKYFNWVPYDEISHYEILVLINGKYLNDDQVQERYKRPKYGQENRNYYNLISIVRDQEQSLESKKRAEVKIKLITNGNKKSLWIWPADTLIQK